MYDATDLDAIQTLQESPGYRMLRRRTVETIEKKRDELERPASEATTAELRGFIAGLRCSIDLPNILQAEIEQDLKEL